MAGIAAYGLMVIVIRRHVNRPEIGNVGCLGQGGARLRIEAKHVVRSLKNALPPLDAVYMRAADVTSPFFVDVADQSPPAAVFRTAKSVLI
jgi:hypothetical protein